MLDMFLWLCTLAVLLTTALPLTRSQTWWVRMWDFPRLHIAVVALVTMGIALPFVIAFKGVMLAILLASLIYHAVLIYPYTPLARIEIPLNPAVDDASVVSVLAANVLMENDRYGDLIDIITECDPDVLFLMETDAIWDTELADLLARYPTVKRHIADDHYGMIFATRLDATRVDFLWPDDDTTPALKAVLNAPNGVAFNFVGLHPRPPVPGNDTVARDAQIKDAALMTDSSAYPTVCMGDFNDVAWSWTSRRFKKYGNFLEPRVGRGMVPSFDARSWWMRLPIDQLYLTKNVNLVSFDRLAAFGSDHYPLTAKVFF